MDDWQRLGMDGFSVHLLFSAQVLALLTVTTHGTCVVVHVQLTPTTVEYNKYSPQTLQSCHKIRDMLNALVEMQVRIE